VKALDRFVRARKAVKADRAMEQGIAGHQAAMAALGKGAKEPGDAPRKFIHSGGDKGFYAQGKHINTSATYTHLPNGVEW
jgi:hypothetical protein